MSAPSDRTGAQRMKLRVSIQQLCLLKIDTPSVKFALYFLWPPQKWKPKQKKRRHPFDFFLKEAKKGLLDEDFSFQKRVVFRLFSRLLFGGVLRRLICTLKWISNWNVQISTVFFQGTNSKNISKRGKKNNREKMGGKKASSQGLQTGHVFFFKHFQKMGVSHVTRNYIKVTSNNRGWTWLSFQFTWQWWFHPPEFCLVMCFGIRVDQLTEWSHDFPDRRGFLVNSSESCLPWEAQLKAFAKAYRSKQDIEPVPALEGCGEGMWSFLFFLYLFF